jgi:four helix bundle suffix protein
MHGGFRNLKTFQLAELIYDITVRFCDAYIAIRSRTHDQMVQSARSGCQNVAEGSMDSATSKKMELKLTGVARGSLMELRLDYENYLRQHNLPQWKPDHPALTRFKARHCASVTDFRKWVAEECAPGNAPAAVAANGALSLLNLCLYLLGRQLDAQARAFARDGGFTEKLYQFRKRHG